MFLVKKTLKNLWVSFAANPQKSLGGSVVAVYSLHVHSGVQVLPGGGRISSCSVCGTFGRGSDTAEMENQNSSQ